ncbi:MAG TPA: class I SAM-dependent methyltransferase [Solirubrobacterales bacterium]|nr:class I SAM-dependent methyltransferase [Solirubrobacterales bacterium]
MPSSEEAAPALLVQRNARIQKWATALPGPLRNFIRAIWHAWLHLLASRAWVRDFAIPVVLTALARVLVGLLQQQGVEALGSNAFTESAFDISVLLGTMAFVRWSITWGVPAMMANVRDIAAATQEPKREFLRELSTEEVATTRAIVRGLTGTGYRVEHPTELRRWFEKFFDWGGGEYIGVDSHGPGEYMAQFEWFLDAHASSLEDRGLPKRDRRVLTNPKQELALELRHRKSDYQSFYRWHLDHSVDITWLDSRKAAKLRREYGVGDADVALWENFAVLFEADETGCLILQMWFPGETERDGTTYERISQFVSKVLGGSIPLEDVAPGLDLVDRELAEEWINYLDPESRSSSGVGTFLSDVLSGRRFILDAAGGIGADSVYLLSKGYHVTTNEVDELLRAQAEQYASSQQVRLNMIGLLWEDLPEQLRGNMKFEAILCLGNSLCLVDDTRSRVECLRAFRSILVDGGILVIDERNFQLMLDNAHSIEADPIENFPASTRGDVMYQGKKVRGYPAHIDRATRTVRWRFFRNSPPIESRGELEALRLGGPDLLLHAFSHGELFDLLKEAGFGSIDVYADLKPIAQHADSMPDLTAVGRADFITYVARI